jgi:hypothetical protein
MNPRPQEHQENPEVSAEQRGSNELIKPIRKATHARPAFALGTGRASGRMPPEKPFDSAVHNRSSGEISQKDETPEEEVASFRAMLPWGPGESWGLFHFGAEGSGSQLGAISFR